jgi:hypothetical protein
MIMTGEVGRLQKERQALEQQIADLFTFYAKQKSLTAGLVITVGLPGFTMLTAPLLLQLTMSGQQGPPIPRKPQAGDHGWRTLHLTPPRLFVRSEDHRVVQE